MSIQTIMLYVFVGLASLSAVAILFTRNVFKAALFLLICLLSIAALYVFAMAEFVAITQIMIYAGGVVVIILFGVMLTTRISGTALKVENNHILGGLAGSGFLLLMLIKYLNEVFEFEDTKIISSNTVTSTGMEIMTEFVLPFEVAGIMLLIALIGAAVISAPGDKQKKL